MLKILFWSNEKWRDEAPNRLVRRLEPAGGHFIPSQMAAHDANSGSGPTRPHGVAHVLIYPCGKACKNPPFPSRFIVSDRSSPSRVRFAASRPGLLRADPKDALLTRGKGKRRPGWFPSVKSSATWVGR